MKNNLRHIRKKYKITLEKLSEISGICKTSIAYYELGRTPRLDSAYAIANALKMDVEELFPNQILGENERNCRSDTANAEPIQSNRSNVDEI